MGKAYIKGSSYEILQLFNKKFSIQTQNY